MMTIALTQGKSAMVDDADYAQLSQYRWCTYKSGRIFYAGRHKFIKNKRRTIYMHREILRLTGIDKIEVDHQDGNGLNNQRVNLRPCTHSENMGNQRIRAGTSIYKGVAWNKQSKNWRAKIVHNNKSIHMGSFDSQLSAALAYDAKARELYGEFARTNFPIANVAL